MQAIGDMTHSQNMLCYQKSRVSLLFLPLLSEFSFCTIDFQEHYCVAYAINDGMV